MIRGTVGFDRVDTFGIDQLFDAMTGTWYNGSNSILPGAPGPDTSGQSAYKWFGAIQATRIFDKQTFWCVGMNVLGRYINTAQTSPYFQNTILQFANSRTPCILSVCFEADGTISVRYGGTGVNGGGALAAATTRVFPLNTWIYLEVRVSGFGSGAQVQLWVNDVNVLGTTAASGPEVPDRISLCNLINSAGAGVVFDNVYMLDGQGAAPWNDRLGPIEISTVSPNSDASGTWFSTVNGSYAPPPIYTSITDIPGDPHGSPDDDYSFVSPLAITKKQYWTTTSPQCYGLILGVMVNQCFRGAMGSTTCDALLAQAGIATFIGTSVVNGPYHTAQQFIGLSPATGINFTAGEVGGSFWGASTSSPGLQLTQMYLEILTSLRNVPFNCGASSYSF
jgi:hypothetical protein